MWLDFEYDDDISKDRNGCLDRSERPKKHGHNIIKTSKHDYYFARTLPWYTSGFE